jgi:hypothetical protein
MFRLGLASEVGSTGMAVRNETQDVSTAVSRAGKDAREPSFAQHAVFRWPGAIEGIKESHKSTAKSL